MINEKYLIEKQAEWVEASALVQQREYQMLIDLITFHGLARGDAVETAAGRRLCITKMELRDYCGKWSPTAPIIGMPLLVVTGVKVTRAGTLHRASHKIYFNTSHSFKRLGRFSIGPGKFDKPRGELVTC